MKEIRYNECNLYNKKIIHSYDMKRTSIQNIIEEAGMFCRLEEKWGSM